jgi:hypothetical protein
MDVCVVCVVQSGQKAQPGQSSSTDEVQRTNKKIIPPRAWMFVCCECCVLSGRVLCDGPIPRPEESYRLWLCDCV